MLQSVPRSPLPSYPHTSLLPYKAASESRQPFLNLLFLRLGLSVLLDFLLPLPRLYLVKPSELFLLNPLQQSTLSIQTYLF